MKLYDHDAEQDFRDGGEVWLHWGDDVTVELMRETLEQIMEEMNRLRTQEDLMMKLDEFTTTCSAVIEDFILFAMEG